MAINTTQPVLANKNKRWEIKKQEKINQQRRANIKKFLKHLRFWLIIGVLIGGGIWGAFKLASYNPQNSIQNSTILDKPTPEDWIKGNLDANIVIIEYSDFQCPACSFYFPMLKALREEFTDQIAIVYRHFPLPIHRNAKKAAYAAEAAGQQGKFWEMHDLIFDNQKEWQDQNNPENTFFNYAKQLNLNIDQFKKDLANPVIHKKIDDHYKQAFLLKLNYTPTFFINGKKINNPQNYEQFKKIILQILNSNVKNEE
jgi:protein-disulfide isomerase